MLTIGESCDLRIYIIIQDIYKIHDLSTLTNPKVLSIHHQCPWLSAGPSHGSWVWLPLFLVLRVFTIFFVHVSAWNANPFIMILPLAELTRAPPGKDHDFTISTLSHIKCHTQK